MSDGTSEDDGLALSDVSLTARLKEFTPARVGLRRAGISLATQEVLDFQLAHGRARDAVHQGLQPACLVAELSKLGLQTVLLHSAALDRRTYLQRPDLGRRLEEGSRLRLLAHGKHASVGLAIVLVDGLSALAVERHAVPLLTNLLPALGGVALAPVCIVEQGRVAVGDEIAELLEADLVVVLIGERPGLSSPDSLGAYITWKPRAGVTTDAERNCISNIRLEGLSYAGAAARLCFYLREAMAKCVSGIALKDPESLLGLVDRDNRSDGAG